MSDINEANEDDAGMFGNENQDSPLGGADSKSQVSEIDVTEIEAETLLLSMKAIGWLLKEDT